MPINLIDRKFRNARVWSNKELKKIANIFTGSVCNISAWRDQDKEGTTYESYFINASSYSITNYPDSNARGFQPDYGKQIILDLEKDLDASLIEKFDVVFNHTTLEHVFDCQKAFSNICSISKDIVILVVPFLQETHADYGDYWRFTPQGIDRLFTLNGLKTIYYNCNDQSKDSIYLFFVASKFPDNWQGLSNISSNRSHKIYQEFIGTQIIKNSHLDNLINLFFK